MQSTQRGLIALGATRLLPISKLLQTIGLGQFANRLADLAVRNYQKHLSPHKGFSCAYCRLHGGVSCSGYFREVLAERGLSQALRLFPDRLQACQTANYILRMQMSAESTTDAEESAEVADDSEETTTNTYRSNSCNSNDCDALASCADCGSAGCDAGACDGCDAGGCDGCSGCDGCNF